MFSVSLTIRYCFYIFILSEFCCSVGMDYLHLYVLYCHKLIYFGSNSQHEEVKTQNTLARTVRLNIILTASSHVNSKLNVLKSVAVVACYPMRSDCIASCF